MVIFDVCGREFLAFDVVIESPTHYVVDRPLMKPLLKSSEGIIEVKHGVQCVWTTDKLTAVKVLKSNLEDEISQLEYELEECKESIEDLEDTDE